MYSNLVYILITLSFIIILCILLQPSKQQDVLSLLSSDKSDELFKTQRTRGVRYVLQFVTAILGIIWFILCIVLTYMANR